MKDEDYERACISPAYLEKELEALALELEPSTTHKSDAEKPGWIPVSERMPGIHNYSENYLVTLKRGGVHIAMFTECSGKHWWTYDDVVAWMPLPEPYKAESEEQNED